MTFTVAASLKKIALLLIKSPKFRKFLIGLLIIIVVLLSLPSVVMNYLFGGDSQNPEGDYDPNAVIWESLSESQKEYLTNIYTLLDDSEIRSKDTEATVLIVFYLGNHLNNSDFPQKFVSCFDKNQDTEALIENINSAFGENINANEFKEAVDYYKAYLNRDYEPWETVINNLDSEIRDMVLVIEEKLETAKKSDMLIEARILTVFFLSEYINDSAFSSKLIYGVLQNNSSIYELVNRANIIFNTDIPVEKFKNTVNFYYDEARNSEESEPITSTSAEKN